MQPNPEIPIRHTLYKLRFNDFNLRIESLILLCISRLEDEYMIRVNPNPEFYNLYPANKEGQRCKDYAAISLSQKVKGIGIKRFYLEELSIEKTSISTHIDLERKYGFERKDKLGKQGGCCSIFKL